MFSSERIYVGYKKKEQPEYLNASFSNNNSFYEKLPIETKRDILFLIKSDYNKKQL